MTRMSRIPSRQRGAALVIGLILLLILTLLAVTGMNTSNMELVMAGNEQYRQRAFQAADTGIEAALTVLSGPTVSQISTPQVIVDTDVVDGRGDHYKVTAQYQCDSDPPSGFNVTEYAGINYELVSTGTSARNASTELTQGAYLVQKRTFSPGC